MVNIRTTSVALLVDREVDRNLRTTSVALFVDRSIDRLLETSSLLAVIDAEQDRLNCVSGLYLIVDCELAIEYPIFDTQNQSDIYTAELIKAIVDTQNQVDNFNDFKIRRADVLTLYSNIVNHINAGSPFNSELDFDDDGLITNIDLIYVNLWYLYGDIWKSARAQMAWSDSFEFLQFTPIERTIAQTWVQTQQFTPIVLTLGLNDLQNQQDQWINPTTKNISTILTQYQISLFTYSFLSVSFSNTFNMVQDWDLENARSRLFSDIWNQSDAWSRFGWLDDWEQLSTFSTEDKTVAWTNNWRPYDRFQPPHTLDVQHNWQPTTTYDDAEAHGTLQDTWIPIENWHTPTHSVAWADIAQSFQFLSPGNPIVLGMVPWLNYELDPVRDFSDYFNWHEQWQIELPTETITETWISIDSFSNEIKWENIVDTLTPSEFWFQQAGLFISDIQNQISIFDRLHDQNTTISTTFNLEDFFYYESITTCTTDPHDIFTLIDGAESLILRNATWGNITQVESTRSIGSSRSGTPYVFRQNYWPQREVFKYDIKALTEAKCDSVLAFIERNIGRSIQWKDHYGVIRTGYIQEPATPVIRRSRGRSSISLTLVEGD